MYTTIKAKQRFYKSGTWRNLRLQRLLQDGYQCQECKRNKRYTRADTVHHITPIEDDASKALDVSNLVSVCRACHNRHHPEKGGRWGNKRKYKDETSTVRVIDIEQ